MLTGNLYRQIYFMMLSGGVNNCFKPQLCNENKNIFCIWDHMPININLRMETSWYMEIGRGGKVREKNYPYICYTSLSLMWKRMILFHNSRSQQRKRLFQWKIYWEPLWCKTQSCVVIMMEKKFNTFSYWNAYRIFI